MRNAGRIVVGVGGIASNVGKTELMCELLKRLPGWEAIKTTKGHYRSCGKDPHACCVSHLLKDKPAILSGRAETYEVGKDTGRYWDAGAANVHWVIATEAQVGDGIQQALERVNSSGVLVEGNSFAEHVPVDLFVMVTGNWTRPMKRSARQALQRTAILFDGPPHVEGETHSPPDAFRDLPVFRSDDIPLLIAQIKNLN